MNYNFVLVSYVINMNRSNIVISCQVVNLKVG